MIRVLIPLLTFLLLSPISNATTIYLKNGNSFEGTIIKQTQHGIWIKISAGGTYTGGEIKFDYNEIESIDRTNTKYAPHIVTPEQRQQSLRDYETRQQQYKEYELFRLKRRKAILDIRLKQKELEQTSK